MLRSAPWLRLAQLGDRLAAASFAPEAFRTELRDAHAELAERFRADESVEALVHARAELIDAILREVWRSQLPAGYESWTLAAVGGYGRGELHPHSDVDILILVPAAPDDAGRGVVERVVTFLWDINLEVGHSVRTVAQCAEESAADVGVMTTLIEARLLAGNAGVVRRDARGRVRRSRLARQAILRSQGCRAAGPAPQGQRHRLQPRAQREDRPRAACATSRPSPGWPSATSARARSTNW